MMPELYEPEQLHQLFTALVAYTDSRRDKVEIHTIDIEGLVYEIYVASRKNFQNHMPEEDVPKPLNKDMFLNEMGMDMPVYMSMSCLYRTLEYAWMLMKDTDPPEQAVKDVDAILANMRHEYKKQYKVDIYFSPGYCDARDSLLQKEGAYMPEPSMRVLINNPDYRAIYGAWVALPSTYMTISQIYNCSDLMPGECSICGADIVFYDGYDFLKWDEESSAPLDLLNYIASMLSELGPCDADKLRAISEWGLCRSQGDTAVILSSLDDFFYSRDITTPSMLGMHLARYYEKQYGENEELPVELRSFIQTACIAMDMEQFGNDYIDAGNGIITGYGYVGTAKADMLREIMGREVCVPKRYEITPTPQSIKERNGECR